MKVSKTGYKKNSKDKNEPALVIPSNKITMKGVEFPVLGTDNTGYSQMMYPGLDYSFPGSYVHEVPMAEDGYILPGRFKNPEGNWLSKYAGGGDISIPDLSRPNWLDKAQKGQQVKYYDDLEEFKKANRAYQDSLEGFKKYPLAPYFRSTNITRGEFLTENNPSTSHFSNILNSDFASGLTISPSNIRPTMNDYEWVYKRPTQKPVYKEKPKVEPISYKEGKLELPNKGLAPINYMPPSNTAAILSKIKEEDMYKQKPKVVPAPTFKTGGWLDRYQVGGSAEPMSWTDYLKYMGADDAELKSINPRDYLLWEEDQHTLLKDLDPEKAKNARAAKINFYDKSARHTPHESDLLKDAYASRKADLIDTYNLLYFNDDKQDYSGSPGNVTKWENGKDVFYPGKFAIENEGNESLTAQEILDRAKTNYSLPIQDYASQRIKNRPNYADTKIPYTRVYPRTLLMDYNNPSADFNAGIEYMNDPRYTDVTENFYSDPPSARPMSFFPAPSYKYANAPKRYDEKGNEVISKYDVPNIKPNTYYDFPGSTTEMIYNEKLRLNDITKENIRNIKTIDPSGNIGDIDYNTPAAKKYINDPWFYYGKERHDGDPYCVNCDKLSGSEHSQDNLFDYFKFKPQSPSSKMWWMKTFGLKPPRPIFLSQPNATSTGQVQIGWDIWDPKQQQWKAQNFSTDEINRRREEVKVPKDGGRDIEFKDSVIHDLAPYSLPPDIKPGTVVDTNNKPVIKEKQSGPKVVPAPSFKGGGWLEQYQDAGEVKTYTSDPNYFNNRAVFVDNPQANELVRSKVYAGTHGWDPSSNSLVKLDKPVAVPEAVREMSTADWGKKSSKERFESDTPAGKATRKAVAAREMEQAVTNPYFRGAIPAMLAAPAMAAAGPSVLSALNTPAVIGSTTLPGVTAGNIMGAGFAADALVNRLPQIPGQLSRGEYSNAAINAATGALDLYGANMISPLYKGAKAAGNYIQSVNPLENFAAAVNSRTFNKNYDPLFKFYDRYGYVPDYTVGKPAQHFEFANKNIYRNIHPSDLQTANELGYVITPSEKALGLDAALTNENAQRLIKRYNSPSGSMELIPGQAGKIDGYHPFFMEGNKLFDTKNIPRPLLRFNPEKAPDVNINDSFLGAENFSFHPKANTNYRIAVPDKATRRMSNYDQLQWDSELKTYVPIQQTSDDEIIRQLLKAGNKKEISKMLAPKSKKTSTVDEPFSKTYPTLSKHDELVRDSYTSGRWPDESAFWRWYNKKEHGLDYDRPIPKFFDPTIPVKKQGGWLDTYKNGGVKSSGEGYYDYINGYSGIFAKGGPKGWLDNYK